mgnify:CR=1 FL=1
MSTDFEVENDTFDFESPEDFKTGGAFLAEGDDGTYHVEVSAIEKDPKKQDGGLIQNAAFKVTFLVLDGSNKACKARTGSNRCRSSSVINLAR